MIQEVRPGIFWLHPPSGGEMYIVRTNEGLVLIDSGFFEFREMLLADMAVAGLNPHEITLAFATHVHCDHVAALGQWRRDYDFPVVAHQLAADPIEQADRVITASDMPYINHSAEFIPCPIAHRVLGGEVFTRGERAFTVIHAPGHSIGSIHILSGDELFIGDTVFEHGGIGWMDIHWGSNPEDYVETLQRMRPYIGRLALPGHGAPYVLRAKQINTARRIAAFYIPTAHGLGSPRAQSAYRT